MIEQSDHIDELAKALNKFQADMAPVKKGSKNPFFKSKYASIGEVLKHIQEPLTNAGLSLAQFPGAGGLSTQLMHESGQWIREFCPMPSKDNSPQSVGSSITYARRYCAMSVLGLPDEDDDGNAAETGLERIDEALGDSQHNQPPLPENQYEPETGASRQQYKENKQLTENQVKRMYAIVYNEQNSWTTEQLKEAITAMGYDSSKSLIKRDYDLICDSIEKRLISFNEFMDELNFKK